MRTIIVLHPFTPQAAGVVETSVATYHSQPHLKAMQMLVAENLNMRCVMGYFTTKLRRHHYKFKEVDYQFYPVDFKWNGDHRKWKKQWSKNCLKAYKNQTPDVTIINMSGHSSPFSHALAKIILKAGKKYVPMLGGQHYTDTPENRNYFQTAHHILVHTQLQKTIMKTMPMFEGTDIRVFPLGVDTQVFVPKEKEIGNELKLLYVGRIVEWKQIHLAIDTLHLLVNQGFPHAHLDIIGPVFSENYHEQLKKQVKTLGIEQHVSFLGHKEHHELPEYFQQADLFLLPSHKETFGMVMVEAMACGTPVAAMDDLGGPKDVITHGVDGLLANVETYANTVLDYFNNDSMRVSIAAAARTKAVSEYSLDATYNVLKQSVIDALGN